jgi:hypothetical protein
VTYIQSYFKGGNSPEIEDLRLEVGQRKNNP